MTTNACVGIRKSIIIKGQKSPDWLLDEVCSSTRRYPTADEQRDDPQARHRDALLEGLTRSGCQGDIPQRLRPDQHSLEPRGAIVEIARNGKA